MTVQSSLIPQGEEMIYQPVYLSTQASYYWSEETSFTEKKAPDGSKKKKLLLLPANDMLEGNSDALAQK